MQVSEAVSDYLSECKRLQPQTQKWYKQKLDTFANWCDSNGVSLEQINKRTVTTFIDHITTTRTSHKYGTLSTYTTSGYVQVIKGFANWCADDDDYEEYVSDKTARRIKKPTPDEKIIETFTDEQITALYKATEQGYTDYLRDRDACMLDMLLSTGIRSGELCGLTISNVFLSPDDAHIKVFGKRRKWREVGLPIGTRRRLKKFLRKWRPDAQVDDLVFLTRERSAFCPSAVSHLFIRLGKLAGITGVRCSPHTCRHTFAINYMRTIGDIYTLCLLMGHGSVKVTEVYLKSVRAHEARKKQK